MRKHPVPHPTRLLTLLLAAGLAVGGCDSRDPESRPGVLVAEGDIGGFELVRGTSLIGYIESAGALRHFRVTDIESSGTTTLWTLPSSVHTPHAAFLGAPAPTVYWSEFYEPEPGQTWWRIRRATSPDATTDTLLETRWDGGSGHFAVSPDQAQIAYRVAFDTLLVRDLSGSAEFRVPLGLGYGDRLQFSPSGQRLLIAPRAGRGSYLLVDSNGTALASGTIGPDQPSGRDHVYRWADEDPLVLVTDANGRLQEIDLLNGASAERGTLPLEGISDRGPGWSPDGGAVAYSAVECVEEDSSITPPCVRYLIRILIEDLETGAARSVAQVLWPDAWGVDIRFAEDGDQLIYMVQQSSTSNPATRIYATPVR